MSALVVNEIFYSIQGESTHTGLPCVFIRLTGCNLRCTWCDTTYAFHEGRPMTLEHILAAVRRYPCRLVEVTGGEPLLQAEVHSLLSALCDEGFDTLLETGGSLDISGVDHRVRRIVDLKCPGSGMADRNLWSNLEHLRMGDEVKFVVRDRVDFDWACDVTHRHRLAERCSVLVSGVFGEIPLPDLARWILEAGIEARLQIQLHKIIWEPSLRGV
jgi:7-carboxy-7-deazaguanine synthase